VLSQVRGPAITGGALTQVVDLFEALKQSLKELPMKHELTKAQKWKQHADAGAAVAKHWRERLKARAVVMRNLDARWQAKLDDIVNQLDDEVVAELDLGEPKDEGSG